MKKLILPENPGKKEEVQLNLRGNTEKTKMTSKNELHAIGNNYTRSKGVEYNPELIKRLNEESAKKAKERKNEAGKDGSHAPESLGQGTEPFDFQNPDIVSHDYIQIPQFQGEVISKFEIPGHNNLNFQDTHFKLHDNGLYMPEVPLFMQHFRNVVEAYKSNGKKHLFDSAGNPISEDELKDIYLHLTKDHIAAYESESGNLRGAWTWLDAKFENDEGNGMKILSRHRTFKDSSGEKVLKPEKIEALEACLMEDSYIDFNNLNSQGLPTRKSQNQEYKQGENIYYWNPKNGRVAGFSASSGGADLSCNWGPSDGGSSLGVFAVAQAKDGDARPHGKKGSVTR